MLLCFTEKGEAIFSNPKMVLPRVLSLPQSAPHAWRSVFPSLEISFSVTFHFCSTMVPLMSVVWQSFCRIFRATIVLTLTTSSGDNW